MNKQLTKEQAIDFAESGKWKDLTKEERFWFQWEQKCLCMPFPKFHEAGEVVFGRPVWTHEFASTNLDRMNEELRTKKKPSMSEIIGLLPAEKTIIVETDDV